MTGVLAEVQTAHERRHSARSAEWPTKSAGRVNTMSDHFVGLPLAAPC